MEPHFNEPVRGPAHSPVLQSVGRLPIEPMDPMLTDNAHRSFGTQAQYQTCLPVNGLDVQPDPSTKRQLAREDQYFDNHHSLAPSRATTILRPSMASSPERRFGAICFNPISSTLSRSYVVELPADGPAIQSLSPELEKLEQDPQFRPQGMKLACQIGMAAVTIHFANCEIDSFSGFRLDNEFIISCSHFGPNDPKDTTLAAMLSQSRSRSQPAASDGLVWVNQTFKTEAKNKTTQIVYLAAYNQMDDIAIFRAPPKNDPHARPLARHTVFSKQLLSYEDYAKTKSTDTIWSVGYNGRPGSYPTSYEDWWTGFYGALPLKQRDDIEKEVGKTSFGQVPLPPDFEDFLLPNLRSVAFGRLNIPASSTLDTLSASSTSKFCSHTISAWHGKSGSMVCGLTDAGACIFGIFRGGGDVQGYQNKAILFSSENIKWIQDVLAAEIQGTNGPSQGRFFFLRSDDYPGWTKHGPPA